MTRPANVRGDEAKALIDGILLYLITQEPPERPNLAILDHSDFMFADLKRRTTTVFLILPPNHLTT